MPTLRYILLISAIGISSSGFVLLKSADASVTHAQAFPLITVALPFQSMSFPSIKLPDAWLRYQE